MRPTDKSRQTVVLCSPFCIIKNTGHGNFVVGRFYTRARKWIIRLRLPCVQSPAPPPSPTDTPFQFCSEGRGQLYTGYLERIIYLQTVRQNWRIKSGGLFIQNYNLSIFKLRRITYLTRIIKRITRLTRMIPL